MSLIKNHLYTFIVGKDVSKEQISKIVKNKFSVDVLSVKTINLPAKIKMQRTKKGYFKVAPYKKAVVKLKKGQKIPLFEVAEKEEEAVVTTAEGEAVTTIKEKKSLLRGTKVKIESNPSTQVFDPELSSDAQTRRAAQGRESKTAKVTKDQKGGKQTKTK